MTPTTPQVGPAGARQALVDALLDGDRHGGPAGHRDQRERERAGQAGAAAPGESARPRRIVRQVDSARSRPASTSRRGQWSLMRSPSSSYAVLALPLGLGPLVGGDQVGVARARWRAARRGCRWPPPGRARGRRPRRRARWWPAGRRPPGSTWAASPPRRPARIAASTRGSTALVASSSTSSRGRPASARASVSRWRWPPDSEVPRSPTIVSRPSGSRCDEARRPGPAAAPPRPRRRRCRRGRGRRWPRTVSSKTNGTCGTSATVAGQRRGRSARAASSPSMRDRAGGRVDQADGERGDRRLAGAGRADQRDGAAGRHGEADVVQHVGPARRRTGVSRPRRSASVGRAAGGAGRSPVAVRHLAGRRRARAAPGPSRRRCAAARRAPSRSRGPGRPAR